MSTKTYPGMNDNSIEFFSANEDLKFIQNGQIKNFSEIPFVVSQVLKDAIAQDAAVKSALLEMHPNSQMQRLEQFAKCRFGGLDFQADIVDTNLQNGEYWECPKRGTCKHEGVLCKLPMYNGHRLTSLDIDLMKESCTEKTNDVIAEDMKLAYGSFHKAKKGLHGKLGVQTKQGIAIIAMQLSIL